MIATTILRRPLSPAATWILNLSLILTGSVAVALSAQFSVNVPFSPVPVTGQTLAVVLVGAMLGSRRGFAALAAYLAEGAAGMPVFAGGAAGAARLVGPTGGYLMGFMFAAFVVGWLAEHGWSRSIWKTLLMLILGEATIYLFGLPWLAIFVGWGQMTTMGLYPFIPGALLKIALGGMLISGCGFVSSYFRSRVQ